MKRYLAPYILFWALLVLLAAVAVPGVAQAPAGQPAFDGQAVFEDYCAVCHGRDARGDGPAARALKTPPIDLTAITRSHAGRFPEADIRRIILGQDMMPSHGTEAMPIWGKIFTKLGDPNTVNQRVDAVVAYLRRIQVR